MSLVIAASGYSKLNGDRIRNLAISWSKERSGTYFRARHFLLSVSILTIFAFRVSSTDHPLGA